MKNSISIRQYKQGKLSPSEKEEFEEKLIILFLKGKLTKDQEELFDDLYFSTTDFFEKVKETEKVSLAVNNAVRRGALNFAGAIAGRDSILERLQSFWSSPRIVLAAALLLLVILIPVRQVFYLKSELDEMRKPRSFSAHSFALLPANDALRGGANEIKLSEGADDFILNFNLPKKVSPGFRYAAQILDNQKKVVWEITDLKPAGQYEAFAILCNKEVFESGEYFLRVSKIDKRGEKTGEAYLFLFRIVNNS